MKAQIVKGKHALSVVRKFFPNVKKVEDSKHRLTVDVHQTDVNAAKRFAHAECAMAVACQKKEQADGVIISIGSAYVIKGNTARRYAVPASVAREVVSFDRHNEFVPGSYHLAPPAPSNRIGYTRPTGGPNNKKRGPVKRHFTQNVRTILK